ncbi:hypothetical protein BDV59DRAFT_87718 [Aspergillus ambiguus]|uniref:uncharacterized protein n=1 Tax=Aspergillus ambiguus TaxID=176160 RepID=UPI003CCD3B2A
MNGLHDLWTSPCYDFRFGFLVLHILGLLRADEPMNDLLVVNWLLPDMGWFTCFCIASTWFFMIPLSFLFIFLLANCPNQLPFIPSHYTYASFSLALQKSWNAQVIGVGYPSTLYVLFKSIILGVFVRAGMGLLGRTP